MVGTSRLDAVSRAIIGQLQQDGRRAYASIGRAVGLSEAAVRQRVQRLLDSQALRIVAVTEPALMGFPRQAMLGVKLHGALEPVLAALDELDLVESVVAVAGSFDLLVEVIASDEEQLMELLTTIREIDGIETTETFVYLKRAKQTYGHRMGLQPAASPHSRTGSPPLAAS